jgi:hypothetical protein
MRVPYFQLVVDQDTDICQVDDEDTPCLVLTLQSGETVIVVLNSETVSAGLPSYIGTRLWGVYTSLANHYICSIISSPALPVAA